MFHDDTLVGLYDFMRLIDWSRFYRHTSIDGSHGVCRLAWIHGACCMVMYHRFYIYIPLQNDASFDSGISDGGVF